MSRAFVKEDDDMQRFREKATEERQLREWLVIQEKKLALLKEGPQAATIEPAKREKWIQAITKDIEQCRKALEKTNA